MRTAALRQSRRKNATVASCFAFVAVLSGTSAGQPIPGTNGNLATLPGLTELQQPTATAVNQVCGQFPSTGTYTADPNGTPQQRLFYTCGVMVQTANELADPKIPNQPRPIA